jgi:hypothetical protein
MLRPSERSRRAACRRLNAVHSAAAGAGPKNKEPRFRSENAVLEDFSAVSSAQDRHRTNGDFSGKSDDFQTSAAKSAASDPYLPELCRVWASLSEVLKQAVLEIVRQAVR